MSRDGDLWVLPPVCDTLYVSADGPLPATWTAAACDLADRHEGRRVVCDEIGGLCLQDDLGAAENSPAWAVRVGRLNGFGSYRYVWDGLGRWHGVTMLCAPPVVEGQAWRWFLMLRAERLWMGWMAGEDALSVLTRVLGAMGSAQETGAAGLLLLPQEPAGWKVSRCDICRDHGGYDWEIADLGRFATRSPRWSRGVAQTGCDQDDMEEWATSADGWTYGNPNGSTLYVGRRRTETRFLRVYCKSTEARATGKAAWLDPFWRAALMNGLEGPLPKVWRAEVEFGGGWLKAHGLATADKLAGCERTLWTYYVEAVRHTDGGAQLRHLPPSRVWSLLSYLPPVQDVPAWRYEPRAERSNADAMQLRKMATGCAVGIMDKLYHPATEAEATAAIDAILADQRERMLQKWRGQATATPCSSPLLESPRAARLAADPSTDSNPFDQEPTP